MKQSVKTLKDVLSFGNDVKKRQQDLVRLVVFIDEACDQRKQELDVSCKISFKGTPMARG